MMDKDFWTAIIMAGAVVAALRTIWVMWVRPSLDGIKGAVIAARDIASLLREIRDFFNERLPALVRRFDTFERTYSEHVAEERRYHAEAKAKTDEVADELKRSNEP